MVSNPRLTVIPEALRRARLEAFLERSELAEKADVSEATIRAFEQSPKPAKISTIRAIAKALGCDPSDISEVTVKAAS